MRVLAVILIASISLFHQSSAYIYTEIPDHWTFDNYVPFFARGTNYNELHLTTNIFDTGLNYITNISLEPNESSFINDYVYRHTLVFPIFGWEPYDDFISSNLSYQIQSGQLQELPLSDLENLLGLIYTNFLNQQADYLYTNYYGYDEGDNYPAIPTNFLDITGYSIVATNGLIMRKFEYDWVNDMIALDMDNMYWKPGVVTDILAIDNSGLYRIEAFAAHMTPDLSYTTNIQYMIYTDDPILAYEETNHYFSSDDTPVSYVMIEGVPNTNYISYLDIAAGEIAFLQSYDIPFDDYSTPTNNHYGWKIDVKYGEGAYVPMESQRNKNGLIYNYELNESDSIIGPAQIRYAFVASSTYNSDSLWKDSSLLFRIEKSESQYLAQLETLVDQLSNTLAQSDSVSFTTTNFINTTITNTITNAVGYTLSEVADMRLGSQMVSVSNTQALLRFGLDMSDDLTATWQTNAYEIEVEIPATNDVQFFRLRMD